MKTILEDKKLTICLEGRIDTSNAPAVEEEIFAALKKAPGAAVAVDAADLAYISSAGLRVLLKLKKQMSASLPVANVSPEVYEIFETTGFTSLLDVQKKLREISIEGCEVVGEGANGTVYRLDEETIIKVFAPGVPLQTVQEERNIAQAAFVAGVPTAISYDVAKVGESYGAVYEMLHAKTLSAFIMEHPQQAEEMGRRMGSLLKELHHTPASTGKLPNMLSVYRERAQKMEKYLTKEEHKKLMQVYDRLEERATMLHGDYHPKNIMYMDGELLFIDMGDVGYGHPLLDLGGSYLAMEHIGKINPAMTPKYIGLDFETLTKVWKNLLKEYFGEAHAEEGRKLAEIYGEAKYALTPFIYTKMTEDMAQDLVARIRKTGFTSPDFDIGPALQRSISFD